MIFACHEIVEINNQGVIPDLQTFKVSEHVEMADLSIATDPNQIAAQIVAEATIDRAEVLRLLTDDMAAGTSSA